MEIKPFIKWAGGKTQLIDFLIDNLPIEIKENKKIDKYIEPFIGGGSVFFKLNSIFDIRRNYINDINQQLALTYYSFQNNYLALEVMLKNIKNEFESKKDKSEYYYKIRKWYNNLLSDKIDYNVILKSKQISMHTLFISAYLIFINKTCFNGLYRINKAGMFNVPFGKHNKFNVFESTYFEVLNKLLRKTLIKSKDFSYCIRYVDDKSFVYLDPPYRPLNDTSYFTAYFNSGFDDNDQMRLKEFFMQCHHKGAKVMLSNSCTDDSFFQYNYKDFNIIETTARRSINSNGKKRSNIKELLIKNY